VRNGVKNRGKGGGKKKGLDGHSLLLRNGRDLGCSKKTFVVRKKQGRDAAGRASMFKKEKKSQYARVVGPSRRKVRGTLRRGIQRGEARKQGNKRFGSKTHFLEEEGGRGSGASHGNITSRMVPTLPIKKTSEAMFHPKCRNSLHKTLNEHGGITLKKTRRMKKLQISLGEHCKTGLSP